jgi:hypothetical protein
MVKNKWLILLAVLLLLAAVPTAWAAEIGSIQVRGIEGTVLLYPVASQDGTLKDDFAGVSSDILDETNPVSKAKALWAYAQAEKLPGQACQTDSEGNALFSLLEQGLYLIGSTAAVPEFDPFLVQVPTVINGKQVFHIKAEPKQEDPKPSTPTEPAPTPPSQNIPQTGTSVIPKYLLMSSGILVTLIGLHQMIRGKEESYE